MTDSDQSNPRESFAQLMNRKKPVFDQAKILLVDDKQELLTSLYHLVTLYGYEAQQALGGEAASRRIQAHRCAPGMHVDRLGLPIDLQARLEPSEIGPRREDDPRSIGGQGWA